MVLHLFDCNCMIGGWPGPRLEFSTAEELVGVMEQLGIERALVFHSYGWRWHPVEGNKALMAELEGRPNLYPCWTLLPDSCDEVFLEGLAEEMRTAGVCGVRLFPRDQYYSLEEWNIGGVLRLLEDRRIPLFLEYGQKPAFSHVQLPEVYNICRRYPNLPVILANPGKRTIRIIYDMFQDCPNFLLDLSSFSVQGGIEDVVHRFGARRLLFGTRMPFQDGGAALAMLTYARISEEDRAAIAGKNLEHLIEQIERG